ncbi:MAG: FkbM family methyltransferase [Burkholderiales bacterium]|nr:FkbM family methyltransferase [Burkholderiales bacterium]
MSKAFELLSWICTRTGKAPGFERIMRRLLPPERCASLGEICVIRDGMAFLTRPEVPLGWHVALFGTYEPELRDIVRAILPTGGVAVDVGANVGWHTLLMAQLVGAQGRVFAAEPNPSVRQSLTENLRINRFQQAEVIPFALANAEGAVDFYGPAADDPRSGDGHLVAGTWPGEASTMSVQTRRLDSMLAVSGIRRLDLMKIDVEGFEWPVLQGAEQSIAAYRPHVIFEFDKEYAPRGAGTPGQLRDFFSRHRYDLFAIRCGRAEKLGPDRWPDCADIWAVPAG